MKKRRAYLDKKKYRFTLLDDDIFEQTKHLKLWITPHGYVCRHPHRGTILLSREIMEPPKGKQVDHIDGKKLNNQRCNLRICSRSENNQNRLKNILNTSGFKGVSWYPKRKKWGAEICFHGKRIREFFANKKDAAIRYAELSKINHASFSPFNRPKIKAEALLHMGNLRKK